MLKHEMNVFRLYCTMQITSMLNAKHSSNCVPRGYDVCISIHCPLVDIIVTTIKCAKQNAFLFFVY